MTDQKYLKNLKKDELLKYAVLSLKSGNHITVQDIDRLDNKLLTKQSLEAYDKDILFHVCKNSNLEALEFLKKKAFDLKRKDDEGNTCLHYAAKWGNLELIEKSIKNKYLNPDEQNLKQETALHYQLKEGVFKYCRTAMLLAKFTNLSIKDFENQEPHLIKLKNLQNSFRLEEFLRKLHSSNVHMYKA